GGPPVAAGAQRNRLLLLPGRAAGPAATCPGCNGCRRAAARVRRPSTRPRRDGPPPGGVRSVRPGDGRLRPRGRPPPGSGTGPGRSCAGRARAGRGERRMRLSPVQVDDRIERYLESLLPPREPVLQRLERELERERVPAIGPLVGQLAYLSLRLAGSRDVLEL